MHIAYEEAAGWYIHDEDGYQYGPYATEEEARAAAAPLLSSIDNEPEQEPEPPRKPRALRLG